MNVIQSVVMRVLLGLEWLESRGIAYNPLSEDIINDPYQAYRKMRGKDPVHRMRLIDSWALTSYEHIDKVLRDHHGFINADRAIVDSGMRTLLDLDPPDHTRIRSLVSRAFSPKAVARLETRVQQIADDLLDAVAGQSTFDLMSAYGYPLPVTVIAEMLGVPPSDRDQFESWSNVSASSVEPLLEPGQVRRIQKVREELYAYFETIIEERQRSPQNDMVTALLAAEEAGDRLTREELLSTMHLILVAGNETTRNLIGNGMKALLDHPDQLQHLRSNPDLMDSAIDEFLRFDSPVQIDARMTREDVTFGGKRVPAGRRILCLIGAANRDPSAFPDPDRLDIAREARNHLSFGRGIHYCLGAALAKLEARVAFSSLLNRYSSIRLNREPDYKGGVVLRGLKELWIDVEPSGQTTAGQGT